MALLGEDLLLISMHAGRGTLPITVRNRVRLALPGALLMDLVLADALEITDDQRLRPRPGATSGDAVLDDALAVMTRRGSGADARHWVRLLQRRKRNVHRTLLDRLAVSGAVRRTRGRWLGLLPTARYQPVGAARAGVVGRLHDVLLRDAPPETRDVLFISLAEVARALDGVFAPEDRDRVRGRAHAITEGEAYGEAIAVSIRQAQAAVTGAVVAAIAATSGAGARG